VSQRMLGVEHQVDVAVPLARAYGFWTEFEEFPRFMECVEEVRQLDATHLHWRVRIDDAVSEWEAELVEVRPDERIAWRATNGLTYSEVVSFHPLDDALTRVTVSAQLDEVLAGLARRVERDLERFKRLLED
jgi:uncharacterized membrane protein